MNELVLSIKNLSVSYGQRQVLSEISFDVKPGEIVGIVGESGCGKSTLLKAIFPKKASGLSISSGSVCFGQQDLTELSQREIRGLCGKEIGMIVQNPKASFNPIRTYRKQLIETLKSHGLYQKEGVEKQILEAFKKLNLANGPEILDSCPCEMSGGMNQRIAIALSLFLKPRLLLADEPTSALDVPNQKLVIEELLRIRAYTNTAIILVTHNIGLLSQIAHKAGVLYEGRLVEWGTAKEVLYAPKHFYTRRLLDAVPKVRLQRKTTPRKAAEVLLKLEAVSKEYRRKKVPFLALSQIGLEVKAGEILGVVGESGSGKSTLLGMIAGLWDPTGGEVFFRDKPMGTKRTKADYGRMQMVFQNAAESFDPRYSIRHSIHVALKNLCGMRKREARDRKINELMERVGLSPELADRYPWQLSGGQCQRAAIARAISVEPELLLCDEITSALDAPIQSDVIRLLKKLVEETGMAVIFVSHDLVLVSSFCDKLLVLHQGKCVEAGTPETLIRNPIEGYTKRLLASAGMDRSLRIGTD
ncbi:ABC transporter ATP-binding protein [Lacrimispora sp. JR3]|uniref:ABC transporter ATP-binding protein n=1 Tax=Lacrimispora sinapis TaxID=3111456 RepID=UPI00374A8557